MTPMTRLYCQVTGVVLLLVGVLGFIWAGVPQLLSINEPAEIAVHLITGALAAYAGFSRDAYSRLALLYARVFGIVYLALGLVGFVIPDLAGLIHFDLGCNLVHLVLGVWGIAAGYLVRQQDTVTA